MRTSVRDDRGGHMPLGKELGSGGEGAVYELPGTHDWVAKVYHKPVPQAKAEKLTGMARVSDAQLSRFAAWPKATLHSDAGAIIGIVMPRVANSREIHELYSPAQRKFFFPNANWAFLLHVARNCAATFDALHSRQIVIGDVNQGNVFVSQKTLVTLIDCDSFQFSLNGKTHFCQVGVPHFTPPELQQANLSQVARNANHDNFGLAVLIFHLLFMGRHPYAGHYSGRDDMPIERAIREHRFAYSASAATYSMNPPPCSLLLADVSSAIAGMFEAAFRSASRPSARQWAVALDALSKRLVQCPDDPGHSYPQLNQACPWCRISLNGGPNFFISVTAGVLSQKGVTLDIAAVSLEIEQVTSPAQAIASLRNTPIVGVRGTPLPEGVQEHIKLQAMIGWISAGGFALMFLTFCFLWPVGVFGGLVGVFLGMWWLYYQSTSPAMKLVRHRKQVLRDAQVKLEQTQKQYEQVVRQHDSRFRSAKQRLHEIRANLDNLTAQQVHAVRELHANAQKRQLEQHLASAFICDAEINGIGEGRVTLLESYGIETALQVVDADIRKIKGFGPKLTESLVQWRRERERSFRFDAAKGVPQADLQAIQVLYYQKRVQLERVFRRGAAELQQLTAAAKNEAARVAEFVPQLELSVAKARADVDVLKGT